jgi:hypothetical protein
MSDAKEQERAAFCLQLAQVYADLCRNSDLEGWQVAKVLDAVAKKLYPDQAAGEGV